ncbi:MAG: uroporphyrinogen decarboxylase family protein [Caloramator sp.]|nr:uroporphyrinogen decarboxylase family protein [Caloramator sp.]
MQRNMKQWVIEIIKAPVKKPMPILSFPVIQLMNISVKELIFDSHLQSKGMKIVAERIDSAASVSLMDLSVEAECFGSTISFSDNEVPTVIGSIVSTKDEAETLEIPKIGYGRTGIYIEAIEKAAKIITDRPVFASVIGPFSLAGILMDVSKIMTYCYEKADMVHMILKKTTAFIIEYCRAYKKVGANGVIIAEPLSGIISPLIEWEFSGNYIKQIVDAVQDDNFIIIYHNCGNNINQILKSIINNGCLVLHFGNAINMAKIMPHIPCNIVAMGNIDPVEEFKNGTKESIRRATISLMKECSKYHNFIISSGCDIPSMSKWENIDEFFNAVKDFYSK